MTNTELVDARVIWADHVTASLASAIVAKCDVHGYLANWTPRIKIEMSSWYRNVDSALPTRSTQIAFVLAEAHQAAAISSTSSARSRARQSAPPVTPVANGNGSLLREAGCRREGITDPPEGAQESAHALGVNDVRGWVTLADVLHGVEAFPARAQTLATNNVT